jgi:hypothetical protein
MRLLPLVALVLVLALLVQPCVAPPKGGKGKTVVAKKPPAALPETRSFHHPSAMDVDVVENRRGTKIALAPQELTGTDDLFHGGVPPDDGGMTVTHDIRYVSQRGVSGAEYAYAAGPDSTWTAQVPVPGPAPKSRASWTTYQHAEFAKAKNKAGSFAGAPAAIGHQVQYASVGPLAKATMLTDATIPQNSNCNSGAWLSTVEQITRGYMSDNPSHKVYMITGSEGNQGKTSTGVTMPQYMWKAVCDASRTTKGMWTKFVIDPGADGCGLGTAKQKKDGLAASITTDPFPAGCGHEVVWSTFFT